MGKIKVSEATNIQLDWLVAKIEEATDRKLTVIRHEDYIGHPIEREVEYDSAPRFEWWHPTTSWSQVGPIIEREVIDTESIAGGSAGWMATIYLTNEMARQFGPTPLIAAARCYVVSKLGEEVEIPEELM